MTIYQVLVTVDDGRWDEYAEVEASNDKRAIRIALDGSELAIAKAVAVPLRSFRPRNVKVETQHLLKIG